MSDSTIYVDHGKLEAAAADFGKRKQDLEQILDTLESGLAPMVASWDGAARDMYVEKKAIWERAARDLSSLLQAIGQLTHDTHLTYLDTVTANRSTWS